MSDSRLLTALLGWDEVREDRSRGRGTRAFGGKESLPIGTTLYQTSPLHQRKCAVSRSVLLQRVTSGHTDDICPEASGFSDVMQRCGAYSRAGPRLASGLKGGRGKGVSEWKGEQPGKGSAAQDSSDDCSSLCSSVSRMSKQKMQGQITANLFGTRFELG